MTKYRGLKRLKNSLKKIRNLERRKGDDWAVFSKIARQSSRKQAQRDIKEQSFEMTSRTNHTRSN